MKNKVHRIAVMSTRRKRVAGEMLGRPISIRGVNRRLRAVNRLQKTQEQNEGIEDANVEDKWSDESLSIHIVKLAELSYQSETSRYDSLTASSGRLLTCVSIALVALTAIAPTTMSLLPCYSNAIGIEALLVAGFVIASFVCALIAQFRFKYTEPQSPAALLAHVLSERDEFKSSLDAAKQYARTLEDPYQSVKARNEKISFLLRLSTILLIIAIGVAVVCIGFDCIIALLMRQ